MIQVDHPVNDGVEHPKNDGLEENNDIMVLEDIFINVENYMGVENFDILPEINETDRTAVLRENVQRNERTPTNDSVFVRRVSVDDLNFARFARSQESEDEEQEETRELSDSRLARLRNNYRSDLLVNKVKVANARHHRTPLHSYLTQIKEQKLYRKEIKLSCDGWRMNELKWTSTKNGLSWTKLFTWNS